MVSGGLTRRALVFAAPSLLVPTVVLAAVAPTPGTAEGPFSPVRIPSDDDADLISVEGAVREAEIKSFDRATKLQLALSG